jgi:hypothetical protein
MLNSPTPLQPPSMFRVSDLKSRGWTDQLIKQFLGAPDAKKFRAGYSGGRPAGLYSDRRVFCVEQSAAFQQARSVSRSRGNAVKATLGDKRDTLTRLANRIDISVPTVLIQEVMATAARELISEGSHQPTTDALCARAVRVATRLMHADDAVLDVYHWHAGVRAARANLARRKLETVAQHYPDLARACRVISRMEASENEKMAA